MVSPPASKKPRHAAPSASPPPPLQDQHPRIPQSNAFLDFDDEDDALVGVHLPNDTEAAIHLLVAQFPKIQGMPPFALKTQLYTILQDRTLAERQLAELQQQNVIRIFKLSSGTDDYAIVHTKDYIALLQAQQTSSTNGTNVEGNVARAGHEDEADALALTAQGKSRKVESQGGKFLSPSSSLEEEDALIVKLFCEKVLPGCQEVMISKSHLGSLLLESDVLPGTAPGDNSATTSEESISPAPPPSAPSVNVDRAVSALLRLGALTRCPTLSSHPSNEHYMFALPGSGRAILGIPAGRKELLSMLRRRRHPEMLLKELEKKKLKQSVLGVSWHVRDLLGSGAIMKIETTVGPLIRVVKR